MSSYQKNSIKKDLFIKRYARIIFGFLTFQLSYYIALFSIIRPKQKRLYFYFLQYVNLFGNYLIYKSRACLNHSTKNDDPRESYEWFFKERWVTLKKIHQISLKEWKKYSHAHYLYGFPYQTLGMLNLFGGRCSEERFQEYELINYLDKNKKILDVGGNCGFMAILTSYRLGCSAVAVDINSYAIEIGLSCVNLFRLEDRVKLISSDLKSLSSSYKAKFDAVFAFATQWTADGCNRIELKDYLFYLSSFINVGGYIFFESHCTDVNNKTFLEIIDEFKGGNQFLTLEKFKTVQNDSRYFVIFQRKI